jgi:hypothetical protein
MPSVLRFIKNFCENHHISSQKFLQAQTTSFNVDIITEIANLLLGVCDNLSKGFVYTENDHFNEKMAPRLITD